jgi:hypothetical protein
VTGTTADPPVSLYAMAKRGRARFAARLADVAGAFAAQKKMWSEVEWNGKPRDIKEKSHETRSYRPMPDPRWLQSSIA